MLNGANKALIGDELIQFQNAKDLKNNKYKLSKLLRGRNGTEWAINNHKIGEKFILLSQEIALTQIPNNLIGRTISYKPVSVGKTLAETASFNFTYTAKQLKPFALVHAKSIKDESGNIIIEWLRRSRMHNDWRDYVDVPIAEEFEKYEIDIVKKNKIIRTLETTAPSVTYTKEQLSSDFKNISKELTATIYQISAQIGRGYGTTISLD